MTDAATYRDNAENLRRVRSWKLALVHKYAVRRAPDPIELPPFLAVRRTMTAVGVAKEALSEFGSDAFS